MDARKAPYNYILYSVRADYCNCSAAVIIIYFGHRINEKFYRSDQMYTSNFFRSKNEIKLFQIEKNNNSQLLEVRLLCARVLRILYYLLLGLLGLV